MPRTGVIVMEVMVPVPQSVMIGAVLGAAVEAFLMGPLVPRVIAGMPVIIIMRKAGHRWNA